MEPKGQRDKLVPWVNQVNQDNQDNQDNQGNQGNHAHHPIVLVDGIWMMIGILGELVGLLQVSILFTVKNNSVSVIRWVLDDLSLDFGVDFMFLSIPNINSLGVCYRVCYLCLISVGLSKDDVASSPNLFVSNPTLIVVVSVSLSVFVNVVIIVISALFWRWG